MFIDVVNTVAGLLGLLLTALTLMRVRAVRRAQRDERALVRSLYGADAAVNRIRAAAAHLARSRDPKSREFAQDLTWFSGQIEGVSRALDSAAGLEPGIRNAPRVELREQGYFSPEFLIEISRKASRTIDILMYRPLIVATATVLAALQDAADRGVDIRILTLSPDASDEVLTAGAAMMPAAAIYHPEQLRPQLIEAERRIAQHITGWLPASRGRIEYRRYLTMPGPHFIRSDAVIHWGFVGLLSGPMPIRFDERVFIEVATDSTLGDHIRDHFEQVFDCGQLVKVS